MRYPPLIMFRKDTVNKSFVTQQLRRTRLFDGCLMAIP